MIILVANYVCISLPHSLLPTLPPFVSPLIPILYVCLINCRPTINLKTSFTLLWLIPLLNPPHNFFVFLLVCIMFEGRDPHSFLFVSLWHTTIQFPTNERCSMNLNGWRVKCDVRWYMWNQNAKVQEREKWIVNGALKSVAF